MKTFHDWLKIREAGAGVPYVGQSAGCCGSWQGAPGGKAAPLSSVGPVKISKSEKKHHKKRHA
jgi:hypothetical protein